MATYDSKYKQQDSLFGEPYKAFVDFFQRLDTNKGEALDLGCGQGRDSLFLARLGYKVTGVDISRVGISQMLDKAQQSNLDVIGVVSDFFSFQFTRKYDVVVLDSVLHFSKNREQEEALLSRIATHMNPGGFVCVFMRKSKTKEKHLRNALESLDPEWDIVSDTYIDYVYEEKASNFKSESLFKMFFARKMT